MNSPPVPTPEMRKRVAEECCPPDSLWHWEIRAGELYEVWNSDGVHRKVWSPKHYSEHFAGLINMVARLILEDHRRNMKKLDDDYAGHLCIKIQDRAVTVLQLINTNNTSALESLCFELMEKSDE